MTEEFRTKFKIDELMLADFEYWLVSLRPQQPTLGSLVLTPKRQCYKVGDLTPDETTELSKIFRETELLLTDLFAFDKINYLALMMVDAQVHFHIIPRYAAPRTFASVTFTDAEWPKPPDITANLCDAATLKQLFHHMKQKADETYTR